MSRFFQNRRHFLAMGTAAGLAYLGLSSRTTAGDKQRDVELRQFEMPLETEPHARTFMQWPVSRSVYDSRSLRGVQEKIALIANTISAYEPVVVLAASVYHAEARRKLGRSVDLWDIPTDDLWCRDSGPIFVRSATDRLAVADIRFNGWGNKQAHKYDAQVARGVAHRLGLPMIETGLVGEGGGVEHDGAGTLLAHASSWVNRNRNTGSQQEIGDDLLRALGGRKMIWAPGVMGKDITDYHIDALARFVSPGRVLIQLPGKADPDDPWSSSALATYEILKQATDAEGRQLDIVVLPEPVDIRSESEDFVASYVNYYVCNGAVICAEFGDAAADNTARDLLAQLYPGRDIVSLNVDAIGEAGGGIHCATQQQPMTTP